MKRAIYLLVTVIFILSVVGFTEAEAIQMTPQSIVNLIESATFVSEADIANIIFALDKMSFAELRELFTAIELKKPFIDYTYRDLKTDSHWLVLIYTEMEASDRFVEIYRNRPVSYYEGMAPIREFFAPHPPLLLNLKHRAKITAKDLMKKAEQLEGKAKMDLELQAENLYDLSGNSEFLLYEFLSIADTKKKVGQ